MGGVLIGSVGLFVRPWMPAAAPWGFALPLIFLAGYLLIEVRRQAAVARAPEAVGVSPGYDWIVLLFSLACALLGIAAFVIAWSAEPWMPPEDAVTVDILP